MTTIRAHTPLAGDSPRTIVNYGPKEIVQTEWIIPEELQLSEKLFELKVQLSRAKP